VGHPEIGFVDVEGLGVEVVAGPRPHLGVLLMTGIG
jgi:hypothetical protein